MLGLKVPDICIPPLTGKPEQQRFTIGSGVLTSTCSRHGAISSHPLPERSDLAALISPVHTGESPISATIVAQCGRGFTDPPAPASRTRAFIPQCSPATTHYFSREYSMHAINSCRMHNNWIYNHTETDFMRLQSEVKK